MANLPAIDLNYYRNDPEFKRMGTKYGVLGPAVTVMDITYHNIWIRQNSVSGNHTVITDEINEILHSFPLSFSTCNTVTSECYV